MTMTEQPGWLTKGEGRFSDFATWFIGTGMVLTAASQLVATKWADDLFIVLTLAVIGVILGYLLGLSRFRPFACIGLATGYGIPAIGWQIGARFPNTLTWLERLSNIYDLAHTAWQQFVHNEAVTNPILFLLLMGALFWVLAVNLGYQITRHANLWKAAIPLGLTMVIVQIYGRYIELSSAYLGVYLFLTLMALGRMILIGRIQQWRTLRLPFPIQARWDLTRILLVTASIIVLVAWNAPALGDTLPAMENSWQRMTQPWQKLSDRLSNFFAGLNRPLLIVAQVYGDKLPLGGGNPLGEDIIMVVEAPKLDMPGARYYWRANVFDQYLDGGWTSTPQQSMSFSPQLPRFNTPGYSEQIPVEVEIRPIHSLITLFTPPNPTWVDLPGTIKYQPLPDGEIETVKIDALEAVGAGSTYKARGMISIASAEALRRSGENYPDWVLANYTQLPPTITPRMRQLSYELGASGDNPYDIAQNITAYLRQTITYQDTLPALPVVSEPLDWLLFDGQIGFCNYYASAEVILLRILGIPARLVSGYAQGTPLSENPDLIVIQGNNQEATSQETQKEIYVVRSRNRHAWPEVYFPGYGWVPFEPTANQEPLIRPETSESTTQLTPPNQGPTSEQDLLDELIMLDKQAQRELRTAPPSFPTQGGANRAWVLWLVVIAMLLMLFIFFRWRRRTAQQTIVPSIPVLLLGGLHKLNLPAPSFLRYWGAYSQADQITRAYEEINIALSMLKQPANPSHTPSQRATQLSALLPHHKDVIWQIVTIYQQKTFGIPPDNLPPLNEQHKCLRKAWLSLWWQKTNPWNKQATQIRSAS